MSLARKALAINFICFSVGANNPFSMRDNRDMSIPVFNDNTDCVIWFALNLASLIVMLRILTEIILLSRKKQVCFKKDLTYS